jgi:hypothetical protein
MKADAKPLPMMFRFFVADTPQIVPIRSSRFVEALGLRGVSNNFCTD